MITLLFLFVFYAVITYGILTVISLTDNFGLTLEKDLLKVWAFFWPITAPALLVYFALIIFISSAENLGSRLRKKIKNS
jgi:hypothetical protein